MEKECIKIGICPKCGKAYSGKPALSRVDNSTLICPDCGTREAFEAAGSGTEEQETILDIFHGRERS